MSLCVSLCLCVSLSLSLSLWCVCLFVCVRVNSMIYCLQLVQVQFIDGSSYKGTVHLTAAAAASADRDNFQNAGFPFNSPVPVAAPVFHGCGCLNSFDGFTCVRVFVACTLLSALCRASLLMTVLLQIHFHLFLTVLLQIHRRVCRRPAAGAGRVGLSRQQRAL